MEINLLKEGYITDPNFYQAFINDTLEEEHYISKETYIIDEAPNFPIYMGRRSDKNREHNFVLLVETLRDHFINLDRDIYMEERFWHSYFCLYKRDYLISLYPEVLNDEKCFRNIIIKKFDWENYVYKGILTAQYVNDFGEKSQRERYYRLILNNSDIFNYIIKYEIFRNGNFMINILDIIEETGLSDLLKAKIKDRPELGKDQRYGRRVIFEFNKSYPIVLSPMLDKDELKEYFLKYLGYYYDGK